MAENKTQSYDFAYYYGRYKKLDNIKRKGEEVGEEIYQSDLYQSYLYYKRKSRK